MTSKCEYSKASNPIGLVDPTTRALNTILYGLLVHFTTIWIALPKASECLRSSWWITGLLFHEYWVFLQHSNVLGNPLCQRLDRQYGIALLKSNQHWAIAGTLSAYWCRESLSMFLCLSFIEQQSTRYLILYSLIYHTIKSRGVRRDALERFSPQFGIMRLVIDKFYLNTSEEMVQSVFRLFLQGLDTFIHFQIVSNLMALGCSLRALHVLFVIWVFHAALNQLFRMSTASLMVLAWCKMTSQVWQSPKPELVESSDEETESESEEEMIDQDYAVRDLLRKGRVPDELKGRKGAASAGVDTAIKLETIFCILSIVHTIGLGKVPFQILKKQDFQPVTAQSVMVHLWILANILYFFSNLFFPINGLKRRKGRKNSIRFWSVINFIDASIMFFCFSSGGKTTFLAFVLAAWCTAKSFLITAPTKQPKIFWSVSLAFELIAKVCLLRQLHQNIWVDALVCFAWAIIVINTNTTAIATEVSSALKPVADVVFLGHPAELHDCWALWLLPYSLEERWQKPWWTVLLWPIHYIVGIYVAKYRQKLFGDEASFFLSDDNVYETVRMQTWTACHFGRHFVTHKKDVKRNIEAAARHANKIGVKILCLGALNKAESINGGGMGVAKALSGRQISIIHGNHLTAAAVVETTYQVLGAKAKLFLTGASSKVGWAVACALRDRFKYEILCHSTDSERRSIFKETGFQAASTLQEGLVFSNIWIVGKYDRDVEKYMPYGGTAIVFSVPHPFQKRKDVRVVEAGTLHIDSSRLDKPRRFANKLKSCEIFACHAASIVAAHRLKRDPSKRVDELGPVDPKEIDSWLQDAKDLGFVVPKYEELTKRTRKDDNRVIIIGAGPSGLALAGALQCRGVPHLILEQQTEKNSFGSWKRHFSGLEITTQRKWCNLPGFECDKDHASEYLTANEYENYLYQYAKRFDICIERGITVKKIRKGNSGNWIVECTNKCIFETPFVVVATGKNRIAIRDAPDGLVEQLTKSKIKVFHSSDLNNEKSWEQVIGAARDNKLCMIGFGNSASDISNAILSKNPDSTIHLSVRTVPPIFPRQRGFLRVDTIGFFVRVLPTPVQEAVVALLWRCLPAAVTCDRAFPSNLPRWSRINGRVPVIDKYNRITEGLVSGAIIPHGPIQQAFKDGEVMFDDGKVLSFDVAILATGYQSDRIVMREDRYNGLYCCGFGNEKFLPIKTLSEEAEKIAMEISAEIRS